MVPLKVTFKDRFVVGDVVPEEVEVVDLVVDSSAVELGTGRLGDESALDDRPKGR